jgi:DNA-binding response OmpR family regulator
MLTLLQEGLLEENYQVHVARDGREGLTMAQSTSFDVMILDLTLPL